MRKTLTYSSFVITSLLVILAFVTATTYTQLGVAVILYPLFAFFAYKLFIVKNPIAPGIPVQLPQVKPTKKDETEEEVEEVEKVKLKREDTVIADIDRRAFLKIIGATGISFFLFSLFNRRTGGMFSGRATEPGISALTDGAGIKIDPAERQPLDSFQISEIDDNFVSFYGFINSGGAWFIMKEDPDEGTFRYTKGDAHFSENWANRGDLNYNYYHNVFP